MKLTKEYEEKWDQIWEEEEKKGRSEELMQSYIIGDKDDQLWLRFVSEVIIPAVWYGAKLNAVDPTEPDLDQFKSKINE